MGCPPDASREANDPYGDKNPLNMTHGQETARTLRDHDNASRRTPASGGGSSGVAWTLTFLVMPYLALLAVAFWWLLALPNYALPYRMVLLAVMPDSWFVGTDSSADVSRPEYVALSVGIGVLCVLIGLLIARRSIGNVWAAGGTGRGLLWLAQYPISVLLVLIIVLTPALILLGGAIATGDAFHPDAQGDQLRAWPLMLTAGTALWWAIGSTRRAVRRADRRRGRRQAVPAPPEWHS